MGTIRPCLEHDLRQVGDLYLRVLSHERRLVSLEQATSYFTKLLFQSPWHDESMPSLVYDLDSRIVGFVGRVPRFMLLNGRRVQVSVICHLMVDPGARSTFAGISLLRKALLGSQDLSVCEGNDLSKRVWEGVGGTTSQLASLNWMRVLRPAGYTVLQLTKMGLPRALKYTLQLLSRPIDSFVTSLKKIRLYVPLQASEEELTDDTLLRCLLELPAQDKLRPEYDQGSLRWLLDFLGEKKGRGTLRKTVVRDANKAIIGWYLYYVAPGEISTVAQIGARPGSYGKVFAHMFYHAWRRGAVAITGRVEARFFEEIPSGMCIFGRGSWMQIHSKCPDLIEAIEDKQAFFTPLEGEWWMFP